MSRTGTRDHAMYSRISIRNFRGIKTLDGDGFRRINVIVGRNNASKTTFLEAIFLLSGTANILYPMTIAQLRGQRMSSSYPDPIWRALFHNMNPEVYVEIEGQWSNETQARKLTISGFGMASHIEPLEKERVDQFDIPIITQDKVINRLNLGFDFPDWGSYSMSAELDPYSGKIQVNNLQYVDGVPTKLLPARSYASAERVAQQFSALLKTKRDSDVIDALRIIEPDVERIEVLSEPSGPSIYLDLGLEALVPLNISGEGLVRLFSIILELIASRGGVLLIDEIDNGLHYSVMPKLWKLLGELVEKYDVQVFGTTHNDEIIRTALDAFAGTEGMLGLFRIDKRGDRHVMVGYSDEAMEGVREMHFEVRG